MKVLELNLLPISSLNSFKLFPSDYPGLRIGFRPVCRVSILEENLSILCEFFLKSLLFAKKRNNPDNFGGNLKEGEVEFSLEKLLSDCDCEINTF